MYHTHAPFDCWIGYALAAACVANGILSALLAEISMKPTRSARGIRHAGAVEATPWAIQGVARALSGALLICGTDEAGSALLAFRTTTAATTYGVSVLADSAHAAT